MNKLLSNMFQQLISELDNVVELLGRIETEVDDAIRVAGEEGQNEGHDAGYEDGHSAGYDEGYEEGRRVGGAE